MLVSYLKHATHCLSCATPSKLLSRLYTHNMRKLSILDILVVDYGIKLTIVLVSARIVGMVRSIAGRIMHLVPGFVEFDHKLELLPLVGRTHSIHCVNSTTCNCILGNQLGAVKQLHA